MRTMFDKLAFETGRIIGKILAVVEPLFVDYAPLIAAELERQKRLQDEISRTKIDPKVRIARDRFMFTSNLQVLPEKDTPAKTADELLRALAHGASNANFQMIETLGTGYSHVHVEASHRTAGRELRVNTVFVFRPDPADPERILTIHPDREVERWKNLDRAMKCFLN